jgi:hypothetical protein
MPRSRLLMVILSPRPWHARTWRAWPISSALAATALVAGAVALASGDRSGVLFLLFVPFFARDAYLQYQAASDQRLGGIASHGLAVRVTGICLLAAAGWFALAR